jgi:hypothetical protein
MAARERVGQQVDQAPVEDVRDDEADEDDADADEQTLPQLLEVLDERGFLTPCPRRRGRRSMRMGR